MAPMFTNEYSRAKLSVYIECIGVRMESKSSTETFEIPLSGAQLYYWLFLTTGLELSDFVSQ
jgi:hypothetical protein